MKNYVKKIHTIMAARAGTTMVELLVGFTILIIFMAAFSQVISFSGNLMNKSMDNFRREEAFEAEYYKKTSSPMQAAGDGSYTLTINSTKTKDANTAKDVELPLNTIQLQEYTDENTQLHRYSFANTRETTTTP